MYKILAIVLLLFSMNVHQVFAQGTNRTTSKISLSLINDDTLKTDSNNKKKLKKFSARKSINIKFDSLAQWIEESGFDVSKFTLYIDGVGFPEFKPTLANQNTELQYYLKRTDDSNDAWKAVISKGLKLNDWSIFRNVTLTVRHPTAKVNSEIPAQLILISKNWMIMFLAFVIVTVGIFLVMAASSGIIRVHGIGPEKKAHKKPYSLARTQMALWFLAVIISYVFIWMVTNNLMILTPSVLGLIGISAATGLSAAVVGSAKKDNSVNMLKNFRSELKNCNDKAVELKTQMDQKTTEIAVNPANADELKAQRTEIEDKRDANEKEIEAIEKKIKILKAGQVQESESFIRDILSDNNGVSFHRFQIFAWTIVLIFIFGTDVYYEFTMPNFDGSLLALMGISSGTYIGFKLPEQQS